MTITSRHQGDENQAPQSEALLEGRIVSALHARTLNRPTGLDLIVRSLRVIRQVAIHTQVATPLKCIVDPLHRRNPTITGPSFSAHPSSPHIRMALKLLLSKKALWSDLKETRFVIIISTDIPMRTPVDASIDQTDHSNTPGEIGM